MATRTDFVPAGVKDAFRAQACYSQCPEVTLDFSAKPAQGLNDVTLIAPVKKGTFIRGGKAYVKTAQGGACTARVGTYRYDGTTLTSVASQGIFTTAAALNLNSAGLQRGNGTLILSGGLPMAAPGYLVANDDVYIGMKFLSAVSPASAAKVTFKFDFDILEAAE